MANAMAQVKALVPRSLKRVLFSQLALRGETYQHWLQTRMQALVDEASPGAVRAAVSVPAATTRGKSDG